MSNKLGQSPRRTRIPLSGILGGRQRQTLCQRAGLDETLQRFCSSLRLPPPPIVVRTAERGPPPFPSPASCSPAHLRVSRGRLPWQSGPTDVLVFTSAAGNAEAALCVLTGMSAPTAPSYDILCGEPRRRCKHAGLQPARQARVYISMSSGWNNVKQRFLSARDAHRGQTRPKDRRLRRRGGPDELRSEPLSLR